MAEPVIEPFEISVDEAVLEDLSRRLASVRWPDTLDDAGWDYGSDLDYVRALVDYWRDGYDWRAIEASLNALPQFRTEIDGLGILENPVIR